MVSSLPTPKSQESMMPKQETTMVPPDDDNAHGTSRGARRYPPTVTESVLATAAELPRHFPRQHLSEPRTFPAPSVSRTTKTRIDPTRSTSPGFYACQRKRKCLRHTDHGPVHSPPPLPATRTLYACRSTDERGRSAVYLRTPTRHISTIF